MLSKFSCKSWMALSERFGQFIKFKCFKLYILHSYLRWLSSSSNDDWRLSFSIWHGPRDRFARSEQVGFNSSILSHLIQFYPLYIYSKADKSIFVHPEISRHSRLESDVRIWRSPTFVIFRHNRTVNLFSDFRILSF